MTFERRRGNALVLAVLLLLSLSSVGLIAVQRTAQDLNVAGNVKESTQSWLTSQSGNALAVENIGTYISGYLADLESRDLTPTFPNYVFCRNTSTDPFNPVAYNKNRQGCQILRYSSADSSTKNMLPAVNPGGAFSNAAKVRQSAAFQVEAEPIPDRIQPKGNATDGDICYFLFDLSTLAGIPRNADELAGKTLNPDTSSSMLFEYRTRVLAGPWRCRTK